MLGDVDQHQADQDLVGVEAVAQQRDDGGPEHAAEHAGEQDRGDDPAPGRPCRPAARRRRRDRADHELALGADVPDVGAEAHRQAERDQHQRRRLDRQLAQRVGVLRRLDEEDVEPAQRVLAEQQEQHVPITHGDRQRQQRRGERHQPRRLRAGFKLKHGRPPSRPARPTGRSSIRRSARPSRRRVGTHGERRPLRDHDQPVADLEQLVELLADHQHRAAGVAQRQQLAADLRRGADVDAPGRLRDDQQLRVRRRSRARR